MVLLEIKLFKDVAHSPFIFFVTTLKKCPHLNNATI